MNPDDQPKTRPHAPQSPWAALETIPGSVGLPADWLLRAGEHFPALRALCLQATEWLGQSFPCPRNCGCVHSVIMRHDRTAAVAACKCDPPDCPDIPLTLEDITPLELSWARLARALSKAFGFSPRFTKLTPPNTVQIGVYSPALVPAILTIQTFPAALRAVIAELVAIPHKPFILFAPTANTFDAPCQAMLESCGAAFFPLADTVTLTPGGVLVPTRPPDELFARFSPKPPTPTHLPPPAPRYMLRKGLGVWKLIFDGQEAYLKHERGIFYVAWLLYNPPEHPIHAIDLMAKIPEIYRQQLGLAPLVDPSTGKSVNLESHARIQERSLALDDAQAMRAIYRKEKELEAILDSEDATEPEKAEALRELEELTEFQRQYGRRSRDSARRLAHAVRSAIRRFHQRVHSGVGQDGGPHLVLRAFAEHIDKHILIPSARYSGHGGPYARAGLAGCFTYERPGSVSWTV